MDSLVDLPPPKKIVRRPSHAKRRGSVPVKNISSRINSFQIPKPGGRRRNTLYGELNDSMEKKDLSEGQKQAFREIFDLFDSNGGGTIDAQELDEALRSVDIELSKEEITDVLNSMDSDGNGEIDFNEFLELMTNTERFLESMMFNNTEERRQREVLLFDALTQFMRKAALQSINEIVGYYSNKYKKAQAPHVIGYYAAGARLIGLSEQQIKRHLDQLRENCADSKSPYAQPLIKSFANIMGKGKKSPVTKRKDPDTIQDKIHDKLTAKIVGKITPMILNPMDKIPENLDEIMPPRAGTGRGKIRLKFRHELKKQESNKDKVKSVYFDPKNNNDGLNHNLVLVGKGRGWESQRFTPTHNLPDINDGIKHVLQQKAAERKILKKFHKPQQKKKEFAILTFDDMKQIRKHVGELSNTYYNRIQTVRCKKATAQWKTLAVDRMPSPSLRSSYGKAFAAYTEYRNTPVSSLCSRSLG